MMISRMRCVYQNAFATVAVVFVLAIVLRPTVLENHQREHISLVSRAGPQPPSVTTETNIPKQVFMFWDKGFEFAKPEARLVKQLVEYQNPNFKFYFLNETEAEEMSERSTYIPDRIWQGITIQAKSDIYRSLLLYKYGGIWMDATLLANRPLDYSWLDFDSTDLITFQRFDNPWSQSNYGIKPWVTSWFLAAPAQSYMMGKVVDVISNETQFYRFSSEYFWWHKIVSDLCKADTYFAERVKKFASADPMHCKTGTDWRTAPVNKRCNTPLMAKLFAVTKECCIKKNNSALEDVCAEWNCHTIFLNEEVFLKYRKTIRRAFGGNMPTIRSSMYAPEDVPE